MSPTFLTISCHCGQYFVHWNHIVTCLLPPHTQAQEPVIFTPHTSQFLVLANTFKKCAPDFFYWSFHQPPPQPSYLTPGPSHPPPPQSSYPKQSEKKNNEHICGCFDSDRDAFVQYAVHVLSSEEELHAATTTTGK